MLLNTIIVLVGAFAITIYSFYEISKICSRFSTKDKDVLELFDYFLNKAYETIYESDIITYVSQGIVKIPDEERETFERNYIKQCFLYMGKNNFKLFKKFYGDEETIIVNIVNYMRKRITQDGLARIIQNQTNA